MVTGLVLHDLPAYERRARPRVSRATSLGAGVGIIQIVPGSTADQAGLQIDDEILSVEGESAVDLAALDQRRKSYRRVDEFTQDLQTALKTGPVELIVRREGSLIRKTLTGEPGCGGEISLISSSKRNAWSDGRHVVVTTAMMRLARSDDELAFVIAHEMAHNILGHSDVWLPGIFGVKFGGKRQELAADALAVRLMTDGGYNAAGGISFLRAAGKRFWWNISLDHPGFGSRIATVRDAISSASKAEVPARARRKTGAGARGTGA